MRGSTGFKNPKAQAAHRPVEMLPHVPVAEVHRMNLTSDNRGRRRVAFALVTNHFRFFAASWASHLRARVSSE